MTPENKQRVRDAFNKAMARNPEAADAPIPALEEKNILLTSRQVLDQMMESDGFFDGIDKAVANGGKSFDDMLNDFENVKFPLKPTITPPKP